MISSIQSKCELGEIAFSEELVPFIQNVNNRWADNNPFYVLVYKIHEVQFGTLIESNLKLERKFELNFKFVQEIRIFNQISELYLWNTGTKFCWRFRSDKNGPDVNIYEEIHYIWGNHIQPLEKTNDSRDLYLLEEEHRGFQLSLPFHIEQKILPIKYRIRNYFEFDTDGLIKFTDARLLELITNQEESLYGKI